MICPHCTRILKRTERTGHRCSKCRRPFATDPKDNDLKLHDIRLNRLVTQLSDDGRYAYTYHQLYWAAARKQLRSSASLYGLVPVRLMKAWHLDIRMSTTALQFDAMIDAWKSVYGDYPPGIVKHARPSTPTSEPVLVVLSNNSSVLTCLAANQVPERLNVPLAAEVGQVPPGPPVLLLHDVSVSGYRYAAQVRAQLPGRRVWDASPRPSAVKAARGAAKLREAPGPELDVLRGHLADADLKWLCKGWWSPVAALKPASLINRVETALRLPPDDPETRAAAVSYLTWPS